MKKIVSVKFKPSGKAYFFDPKEMDIKMGEFIIVETSRGVECGEVSQGVHEVPDVAVTKPLMPVLRMADSADIRKMQQNRDDERKAFDVCCEKIAKHKLDMSLVGAEYSYDRSKLLFYFTSDNRVDFRDLVKDLASVFRTRIELRQIGVRDESKMLGGIGICGQQFCCSRFLTSFQPVSIKMAKEQGLSLNPTKISGCCGRLMCCLAYEQPTYEHLSSITPSLGSTVKTPDGNGIVQELNLISGILKIRLFDGDNMPRYYKREECTYISGGKKAMKKSKKEETDPDTTKKTEISEITE